SRDGGAGDVTMFADALRLTVGTDTTYVPSDHALSGTPATGPLLLPRHPALADVTAARGRLVVRCQTYADAATVAEWRADDDNLLALTLSTTQVTLTRTTAGVSQ